MTSTKSSIIGHRIANFALAAVTCSLLVVFVITVTGTAVSFDGAMNLQVAAALVETGDYARFYDRWILFPEEVQTNAPFILPASLAFALFGVNMLSAQLTSIAYAIALIGAAYWLIRPLVGSTPALAATALILVSPEFANFAANGYGEIPGLFWFLLGLGCASRGFDSPSHSLPYQIIAGISFSLAVLTKTVMLMPVGITFALSCMLFIYLRELRNLLFFACAILLPIALFESWRVFSLGGIPAWMGWWADQFPSILAQAGVNEGFDDTPVWYEKFRNHGSTLANSLALPQWFLPAFVLVPLGLFLILYRELVKEDRSWGSALILAALATSICVYFSWWLLITPTEKAWHRRIFNGLILLAIAAPIVIGGLLRDRPQRLGSATLIGLTVALLLYSGAARFIPLDSGKSRVDAIAKSIEFARSAPESARFYGVGWYSAPVFSLYSGRPIYNFIVRQHFPQPEVDRHYLVVDANLANSGILDQTLGDIDRKTVLEAPPWIKIIEIESLPTISSMPEQENASPQKMVNFRESGYALLSGFHAPEGEGWRWVSPTARIRLDYTTGDELRVTGYVPELDSYRILGAGAELELEPSINGCPLGHKSIVQNGGFEFVWSLEPCPGVPAGPVTVEFRTNGLLEGTERALSWVANSVGFQTPE